MELVSTQFIKLSALENNKGQIEGIPANPRQFKEADLAKMEKSLQEHPDMIALRELLVYQQGKKYIVVAGNMRLFAMRKLGYTEAPCKVIPADTPIEEIKAVLILDNAQFGEWDYDALANEWDDMPLADWGVPVWDTKQEAEEMSESEIERKEREFRERIEAGEMREEDEEYQAFLEKFKAKKTTDDCYTPAVVYDAVADWVAKEYGVRREDFVRPFYPNGDYQQENYPSDCVVVDNPPFSILSEILKFYKEKGIKFFLFAPTLTLFSSSSQYCTALPTNVAVTYENGASVNTSFLTNLEDKGLRFRSVPTLYAAAKAANDVNLRELHKELPKYSYDHHIVTSTFVGQLSRLGIDFRVPVAESQPISQLESQKESGKAIYGKGYIVSEQVYAEREKAEREKAEREKAEREKAEREKAERWGLSENERAIIEKLTAQAGRPMPAI